MHQLQDLPGPFPAGPGSEAELALQAVHHVLHHVQPGEQPVLLEHHEPILVRPFHRCAIQRDLPLGHLLKAGNEVEQGGFAATGGAEKDDEFAVQNLRVDRLQRLESLRRVDIVLGDVDQPQLDRTGAGGSGLGMGNGGVHGL